MPTGNELQDGHVTKVGFVSDPSLEMWIISITPFGIEGGGPIPTTTMENVNARTQSPKKLFSVTNCQCVVGYDPKVLTKILAQRQVNQELYVLYPDGSKHSNIWGWLESFKQGEMKEGDKPTATVVFEASNRNTSGVEQVPAYTAPP